jgi:hypothetical protein
MTMWRMEGKEGKEGKVALIESPRKGTPMGSERAPRCRLRKC